MLRAEEGLVALRADRFERPRLRDVEGLAQLLRRRRARGERARDSLARRSVDARESHGRAGLHKGAHYLGTHHAHLRLVRLALEVLRLIVQSGDGRVSGKSGRGEWS